MIRLLTAVSLLFLATDPQAPRDTAVKPTVIGSASVTGVVTLGDDAQTVVRRAVVTLQSADGLDIRSALTNDEGQFSITGLPAGRYSVEAMKAAHVTTMYGSRRPGRPGTALVLTDGQRATVSLTLPRAGVLAGRLTRENGMPVPDVMMMAIPTSQMTAGGTVISAGHEFRTNDLGEFRIYGLLPDTYVLAAVPSFGNGEIEQRSDAEYEQLVRDLRRPAVPGAPPAPERAAAPSPAPTRGFAPLFFPGTPVGADATRITIRPGDVKDGLDFVMTTVPMATIRGTITGVSGQPVQAVSLTLETIGPPMPLSAMLAPRVNRPNARGEFSITGVGPGRYRVRARAGGVTLNPSGNLQSVRGDAQTEWAAVDVTIDGRDIGALAVNLQPGRVMRGRLVAPEGAAPASWAGTAVVIQPVRQAPGTFSGLTGGVETRRGVADAEGRFEVTGLEPHTYEVGITLPAALNSAGWTLGAIRAGDRDLRDAPLTFSEGSIENVEIVLTTAVTELSGRLTSESGAPAADYFIVAFPADRALWHPASPRLRVMRPAIDGVFSTRDLPPGTYRLAALIDVEPDEHKRTDFLESIYDAGISVTVAPGTVTKQDIKIR